MFYKKRKKNSGYTLVETMVATALFLIVIIYGMSAILNANFIQNKSEDSRSIIDNMTFILEDMSRNLRTGENYHCFNGADLTDLDKPKSGEDCKAIAFKETISNKIWIYRIASDGIGLPLYISKSTDGLLPPQPVYLKLNDDNIVIKDISHFSVLGAELPSDTPANFQQPLVNIVLVGEIHYKDTVTPFSLQTSVSQRLVQTQ